MTKLKPCPFCGSEVEIFVAPMMNTKMFVCHSCGADVCFYGAERNKEKAIEKWNMRAINDT